MGYPSFDEAAIFKSRTLETQVRAAVELDYPVFSGSFSDTFAGAALDANLWYNFTPSWGVITVAGSTVLLTTTPGGHISPPYIQSLTNLAFPLRRDTDWTFEVRIRFPTVAGFGVFMRICGRSFRDAEAIWALKANLADGIEANMPDGFTAENQTWSTIWGAGWMRHKVEYDAVAQIYSHYVDANDDGVYEYGPYLTPVAGRYAEAIVIGNSTAIQGDLGTWTEIEVDSVTVTGTAEAVEDPDWAAPFTFDGTRFTDLPTVLSGRVSCDKQNQIDGAELELDNFSLDDQLLDQPQTYTWMRFFGRRCIIEGRAGDGNGGWTPWEVLFDGLCGEKTIRLEGGRCRL
ncbi:MAG: hypothetical protein Q8R28_13045, partial [Dehalococcoidia bacterium]|nr:hypothetical protein [Dehalococcoidia bacterium]